MSSSFSPATTTVLVTGANGFIGTAVVNELVKLGFTVRALVRQPGTYFFPHPRLTYVYGDLRSITNFKPILRGCQVILHLAAAKADETDSYEINVIGTKKLLAACRRYHVALFINLSTLSTKISQPGLYATTKRQADQLIEASRIPFIIFKPSIVYGEEFLGVFGSLVRFARWPLIPVIGTGQQISYPIHVLDVAKLLGLAVQEPTYLLNHTWDMGGPTAVTLNHFLELIAQKIWRSTRVRLCHIPVWIGWWLAKSMALVFSKPPLTVSNILGSTQPIPIQVKPLHRLLNWTPRSLKAGLNDVAKQRNQHTPEVSHLWRYVLSPSGHTNPPTAVDVAHYEYLYTKQHLAWYPPHTWLLRSAILLGGADLITKWLYPQCPLQQKLALTTALVEAHPVSANWLLPQPRSLVSLIIQVIKLAGQTALQLIIGLILLALGKINRHV